MNLKRLMRLAESRRVSDSEDWLIRQHNSRIKTESGRGYGVDFDATLEWVKRKNPGMSEDEQKKFAQNIINKKKREKGELEKGVEKNREAARKAEEAQRAEAEERAAERAEREREMKERDGYDEMTGEERYYYDKSLKGDHWTGD